MPIKVTGIGLTNFGELWDKSLENLLLEVVEKSLADAKLNIQDIDQIIIGNMLSGETVGQSQLGTIISEYYQTNIPCLRVEGACASGGLAVYQAVNTLKTGIANRILVIGIEKMTDFTPEDITELLMQAAAPEERLAAATFPSLYALMAQAHMNKYGTTKEELAIAPVLAHQKSFDNPLAQFRKIISVEDVINSSTIAEPINLLDCSPITDGAASIILERNTPPSENETYILSNSCATESLALSQRKSLTELSVTRQASQDIFKKSKIKLTDIDLLEIHDCFSIATILALEDIGLVTKGQGGAELKKIQAGESDLPPFNISGGLKAFGHPVGATGVKQIAEIALQLQKRSPHGQLNNPRYGLAHNIGGAGASCVMHLLGTF